MKMKMGRLVGIERLALLILANFQASKFHIYIYLEF